MAATYRNLARGLGREHGRNAASWCFDGNTTPERAQSVLKLLADGDPGVYDRIPSPDLSGQWAGGMTPRRLAEEIGATDACERFDWLEDEICTHYEEAFSAASEQEFVRLARFHSRKGTG